MNPLSLLRGLPSEVWTGLSTAVAGLALFGFTLRSCELNDLREEKIEETRRADSLAAEATAERARADGWEVAFGQNVDGLHEALQDRDSSLASLSEDYRASRVRIEQLTEINVRLRGSGESEADTSTTEAGDSIPSTWSGRYDDGVLVADWTFSRRPARPILYVEDWWAQFGIEIVQAQTGDDRTLVTARTSHPDRVQARIDSLFVDRPPPEVRETGLSWWWAPVSVIAGALANEADLFRTAWDAIF